MKSNSKLNISKEYSVLHIEKIKPLCFLNNNLLVYKKGKVYNFNMESYDKEKISSIKMSLPYRIMSRFRLLTRIFRLEPRAALQIEKSGALFALKGFLYYLDVDHCQIREIHKFKKGMSAPLQLTMIEGMNGFDEMICYGEYLSNPAKEEISILATKNGLHEWEKIYTFPKGTVNHVHSIIPDNQNGKIWILTGDFGDSASIWYTDDNFQSVKRFIWGTQQDRVCIAFPTKAGLLYATDTPLENNSLYLIKNHSEKTHLLDLEGPVIFGEKIIDNYIFSTSVEGNSGEKHKKYHLFSYSKGTGVKSWDSHLIIGNLKIGFDVIARFRKDIFPMGLMQFGTLSFPSGINNSNNIVFYGMALKKLDGKMLIIRKRNESNEKENNITNNYNL